MGFFSLYATSVIAKLSDQRHYRLESVKLLSSRQQHFYDSYTEYRYIVNSNALDISIHYYIYE